MISLRHYLTITRLFPNILKRNKDIWYNQIIQFTI
jgi:hypothetical protein